MHAMMLYSTMQVLTMCKFLLLQIATPDALVRLKKSRTLKDGEYEKIARLYTHEQNHQSLKEFLAHQIEGVDHGQICLMQVSRHIKVHT